MTFLSSQLSLSTSPSSSMLFRNLLTTTCLRRYFFSHQQHKLLSINKKPILKKPPFTRSIHSYRVLSMADKQTISPPAQSHTNRLALEHSPYLLQHAHNPVNWYPWGEEAFEEAKKRDIPIFLSIGYSTCHWCHVMEVESFEDEQVAKLLNKWFVSIKVDREERPDVDKVYMTYVQALYGGGGWPLSCFLSPDLKPLMGGTYFPPEDNFGRPGFKTILRKVKEAWESKREVLVNSGAFAIEQMSEALSASASSNKLTSDVAQNALRLCAEQLSQRYDSKLGGFGSAPKFPRPVEIQLMLYQAKNLEEAGKLNESKKHLEMVYFTLQSMAKGGIHDHIGGGFHRYSVDDYWHDMIGPDGEIYSAEDADSAESEGATRKKEGAFYVWTSKEVESVIGEYANLFKEHYYIKPSGTGLNVLIERSDASAMASKFGMSKNEYFDVLGACRKKLFDVRSKRPRPHLDDKVIVSWNGLVISSFARASKILMGEPEGTQFSFPVVGCNPEEYLEVASKAASFIKRQLYDDQTKRLQHSFRKGPSKPLGLLDLYEFGGGTNWLSWAIELQDIQDELFLDHEGGGYFNTTGEDSSVLLRVKEDHDGAEPSGNSVSIINLVRLSSMVASSKSEKYQRNAEHVLVCSFEKRLKDMAMAVPLMCCAADMLSVPSRKQVVLVGPKPSLEFHNMISASHASYYPNKTVIHVDLTNKEDVEFWEKNNENIALMAKGSPTADKVVAFVCQNFTCSAPVNDPEALRTLLAQKPSLK
ncbi:hypothetical protein MKW92_003554 [Papaver armeniacum]|nr:hypothetical protein MKW92_003554 [Papaver armeniacum]